jgi:hypothetical protein
MQENVEGEEISGKEEVNTINDFRSSLKDALKGNKSSREDGKSKLIIRPNNLSNENPVV